MAWRQKCFGRARSEEMNFLVFENSAAIAPGQLEFVMIAKQVLWKPL